MTKSRSSSSLAVVPGLRAKLDGAYSKRLGELLEALELSELAFVDGAVGLGGVQIRSPSLEVDRKRVLAEHPELLLCTGLIAKAEDAEAQNRRCRCQTAHCSGWHGGWHITVRIGFCRSQ